MAVAPETGTSLQPTRPVNDAIRRTSTSYTLNTTRHYITIFYAPVIPLGGPARYVQCSRYGGAFPESALDLDSEAGEERQLCEVYARLLEGANVESVRPWLEGLGYDEKQIEYVVDKMCHGPAKKCGCGLRYHPSATKCVKCEARL
jgi:hypothetical protein